ncbi:MAG TPA: hypothetical protein VI864_04530 [Candidatus Bathyarchaeia archaeon]|nr:hypothetical protein [Candidatus Bathyarchaeia archaeon]
MSGLISAGDFIGLLFFLGIKLESAFLTSPFGANENPVRRKSQSFKSHKS